MFDRYTHIHFIGIGGSGISALAHLAIFEGKKVTGSDAAPSAFTADVQAHGATVFMGHAAKHLGADIDLVIYTEAIDFAHNPEYLAAKKRGLTLISYFEALGKLSESRKTLVVTGTHGKTTTTAMLGQALVRAGFDPTVIMGSRIKTFDNRNIRLGRGEWLVVEGCEYRRSFLHLRPWGVAILNCEPDHMDYYKDEADYRDAYAELVALLPPEGFVVANREDTNAVQVAQTFKGKTVLIDQGVVDDLRLDLHLIGDFNRWNAAHAYKMAELIGADLNRVREGLAEFRGAGRRTEIRGEFHGITVVDDYGHHPTELKATLRALREHFGRRRIICIFQPHQYHRTLQFLNDFPDCFGDADTVIVPNIYAARDREEDKQRINAKELAARIAAKHPDARFGDGFEKTEATVRAEARPGDVVLIMGAGDISERVSAFTRTL